MKKLMFIAVLSLFGFIPSYAQQDAEGCKDHPLLSRLPGFSIEECKRSYDQAEFYDAQGEPVQYEGNLTVIKYNNVGSPSDPPSMFQILRNYENAIKKIGGTKVFNDNITGCFVFKKDSLEYKIKVCCYGTYSDHDIVYELDVLEMAAMKQEIVANDILEALNNNGHIALNILFDTGKSTIKPESQSIVDEIYKTLNENPGLKVSIEGHTDNVGDPALNKKLSEDRASAVMNALIAKGIDKSRLLSAGWGDTKPIADNSTDDGRAKNRRVEIVKK
ncbi:MAG TPA: OmpA family protein [Candidatus Acidoferrales bacterium]|nr:OmpA family protein [Candidatus Acidoferrales bacterium]